MFPLGVLHVVCIYLQRVVEALFSVDPHRVTAYKDLLSDSDLIHSILPEQRVTL